MAHTTVLAESVEKKEKNCNPSLISVQLIVILHVIAKYHGRFIWLAIRGSSSIPFYIFLTGSLL